MVRIRSVFSSSKKLALESSLGFLAASATDVHPSLKTPAPTPIDLNTKLCVFDPHVFIVHPGQSVRFLNVGSEPHSANFGIIQNNLIGLAVVGGWLFPFPHGERTPTPIECNIHPWMKAHMLLFDLPCSGLSDEKGVLKIEKLPASMPITFKIWHEKMDKSIDQVTFNEKPVDWPRGNVQWTLQPGMNDLGIVKISPNEFKTK